MFERFNLDYFADYLGAVECLIQCNPRGEVASDRTCNRDPCITMYNYVCETLCMILVDIRLY